MQWPLRSFLAFYPGLVALSLVVADESWAEPSGMQRGGTVVSTASNGSAELQLKSPVLLQPDQQLLVYRPPHDSTAASLVGAFRVQAVRDDRVFGVVTSGDVRVGDVAPLPRFLDSVAISEAASLRDYAMRIAELDATLEGLRTGNTSFHAAFRKSLEADRIATAIVAQDAKRRIEDAVAEARRQQAEAESAAVYAVQRARLAEQARTRAEEDRRTVIAAVERLEEDREAARENLREALSLVAGARRDYERLVDLNLATQKEAAEQRERMFRERRDFDKQKDALAEAQLMLQSERAAFVTERSEGLKKIAEKLAAAEETFIGDLHAKWRDMDDAERAEWLLTRLSSADGLETPDAITESPASKEE